MAEKRKLEDHGDGARKVPRIDHGGSAEGHPSGAGSPDVERSPEEFLQLFQKEAMWRQLQAYKRESQSAAGNAKQMQAQRDRSEQQTGLLMKALAQVCGQWWAVGHVSEGSLQLHDEIRSLVSAVPAGDRPAKGRDGMRGKGSFETLLEGLQSADLEAPVTATFRETQTMLADLRNAVQQSLSTWDSWSSHVNAIASAEDKQNEIVKVYEREVGRLQAERDANRENLDELQEQLRVAANEAKTAKLELAKGRRTAEELQRDLATARHTVELLERKLDRLSCATTAVAPAVKEPAPKTEITVAEVKVEEDPLGVSRLKEDLAVQSEVAQRRLKEIQRLESERTKLQQELDEARYKGFAGDEKPTENPAYRELYAHFLFIKAELDAAKANMDKQNKELDELRAGGAKLRKQIEVSSYERPVKFPLRTWHLQGEEAARRKVLEGEIRRMEADVNRLRAGRDQALRDLDARISKDQAEIIQNHEIRVIANTRKDRIVALETENQRLRMKLASLSGSREMFDLFDQMSEEDAVSELQHRYRLSQNHVEKLARLAASLGASEQQLDEVAKDDLRSRIGAQNGGAASAGRPATESDAQLQQLELRCEQYQKTEAKLLAEIETIGTAWTQLEEQNSRKVLDLTEKEDQIVKYLAEKAKLEAKLNTMAKQNSTINNMAMALKKQSDKQLEQIRRLEELEKTLSQQIAHLEREIAGRQGLIDGHKRKNAELALQANEGREKTERLNQKLSELVSNLKEKTSTLEGEARTKREMEEELAKLNKKIEAMKADPSGDSELVRQLDEYKSLLKCTTCNTRFKSHVLLKCMHTFCKQCIDTVYDSRQRKCPTCGIPFGQSDVRAVYL
ncbi:hypothetical protein DFJ74DRAFT_768258 [Hyaloraphidium curvatum]|nr:hypothetical protein DFJ74DRAFT_768258 [Hyaloraphidium curvatum]